MILGKLDEVLCKLNKDGGAPQSRDCTASGVAFPPLSSDAAEPESYVLDGLQVPSSFASTDSILTWPVFGNRFGQGHIIDELFIAEHLACQPVLQPGLGHDSLKFSTRGVHEEDIPMLVDRFLHYVHTKNPILNPEWVRRKASATRENGIEWDAECCIVVCVALRMCAYNLTGLTETASRLRLGGRLWTLWSGQQQRGA